MQDLAGLALGNLIFIISLKAKRYNIAIIWGGGQQNAVMRHMIPEGRPRDFIAPH